MVSILKIAHARAIKEALRDLSSCVDSSLRAESGIAIEIFNIGKLMQTELGTFALQFLHSLQFVLVSPCQIALSMILRLTS